jgi:hypothetical protein
LQRILNPF